MSYWQNCPFKTKWVKGNTQKWFNGEVFEKLNSRDKLFHKFKKPNSTFRKSYLRKKIWGVETDCHKKVGKISESIGEPKDWWESLK